MGTVFEVFDLDRFLADLDPELLNEPEGRRLLTRLSPLAFALVYLPHHIVIDGDISLSEFHLDLIQQATQWIVPNKTPGSCRDAYVAPRESGKSTWLFTILPMWAAAHGHVKFIAAFSDTPSQATQHLLTFKNELDTNDLLRRDYPGLCTPGVRPSGVTMADTQWLYVAKSGLVFSARGVDTGVLGLKIGALRPDLIILDDIEKQESTYSPLIARKRLSTIIDAILPLGILARTVMAGTVTMPESIIHQLVKTARTTDPPEKWIVETGFRAHYYAPIIDQADGTRRSLWPERWPLEFLESIEHTRQFAKNYANDPLGVDGDFWTLDDFTHRDAGPPIMQLLSVDGAVTASELSDYTGMAVVSWSPAEKVHSVDFASHYKAKGAQLRSIALQIIEAHPAIQALVIETNQGGDLWLEVFHHMPVPVRTRHQSEPKPVRAQWLANRYTRGQVVHRVRHAAAEAEMVAFPRGLHDDMVDAIGTGVRWNHDRLVKRRSDAGRPGAVNVSYA